MNASREKVPLEFFVRSDTARIARELLGKLLVVPADNGERVSGIIVEVEAYLGVEDRAAHSFGGRRTARNEVMYTEGGHVYVFFVYGMYYQLNFVCGPVDHPHAILIRGVEPIEGIEIMRQRRRSTPDKNLTSGPGKLSIAFGIDRSYNGESLAGTRIWLEEYRRFSNAETDVGKRVGIDYAGEDAHLPLRFCVKGNCFVSRHNVSK